MDCTIPASDVAKASGLSLSELRPLVHRNILLFPGVPGPGHNAERLYSRLGLYEAAILGALHHDLGLAWPGAAAVFKDLAYMLANNLPGKERWLVPADEAKRYLMEHRDLENPVFLTFTFTILDRDVAVDAITGWDGLLKTMRGVRLTGSSAGDAMGILNLTKLLVQTDAKLSALE